MQPDLLTPKPLCFPHNMRRILATGSPAWLHLRWLGLSFSWKIPLVQHERSVCVQSVSMGQRPSVISANRVNVGLRHPAVRQGQPWGRWPSALGHFALRAVWVPPRVYRGLLKVPYATDTCKPDSAEDVRVTEMTRLSPASAPVCSCIQQDAGRQPLFLTSTA